MQNASAPRIVLASSSRYRRELLQRLLDDFGCISPDIDEAPRAGEPAADLVRRLAREKAGAVSATHPGALVIGADQLAVRDGEVIGKPGDHEHALEQLAQASGRSLSFLTAACINDPERHRHEHTDVTVVRFRPFEQPLAEAYLRHDRPYDCAGSFRIEGAGSVLFESVRTDDPTALVGLPMIWLAGVLHELGYLLP